MLFRKHHLMPCLLNPKVNLSSHVIFFGDSAFSSLYNGLSFLAILGKNFCNNTRIPGSARRLRVRFVGLLAAISISSTYRAHWSVLTTGSHYSRMNLELLTQTY